MLYLTEQHVSSKLQHKAMMKLMDLDFKIVYKQGATNKVVDALSHYAFDNTVLAVSTCNPVWLQKVIDGYADDAQVQN